MENEFKKGNYVVTLEGDFSFSNCCKQNYIFKIREDCYYIRPEIDLKGSTTNGSGIMTFDKKKNLKDWRYATPEEIAEYDRLGKPYDVTILQKKQSNSLVGRYLKVVGSKKRKGLNYLLIIEKSSLNTYMTKECPGEWMDLDYRIKCGDFELMPEGFIPPQFEIGKWYTCSCNSNLYQFDGFIEGHKWGISAVINPLNNKHANEKPGYTKATNHNSCIEYFSPSSLADMEIVNKFLPKEEEWFPEIGEWVVIAHSDAYKIGKSSAMNNTGLKAGEVAQVSAKNYDKEKLPDNLGFWVWLERDSELLSIMAIGSILLRKAEPHEIPVQDKWIYNTSEFKNNTIYYIDFDDSTDRRLIVKIDRIPYISDTRCHFIDGVNEYKFGTWGDNKIKARIATVSEQQELLSKIPKENTVVYEPLPFPSNNPDAFKIIAKHDIIRGNSDHMSCNGNIPDIIPKGTITWANSANAIIQSRGEICPENNRWCANIKSSCFEIHPDYINHFNKKIESDGLFEEAKRRYPIGSTFYDLVHKTPFVVDSHKFDTFGDNNQLYVPVKHRPGFSNKTARLYKNGIWAEKVETPIYSAGYDPIQDNTVMATAITVMANNQHLVKNGKTSSVDINVINNYDEFTWNVTVPNPNLELKIKSITTKLNTHVDRSDLKMPELKVKNREKIKF